ncbi:uncharacterized protein BX663DRAFT_503818 [Cokeromyces recurvatus]|uniref:uncharacterized protein n=1 Tax=Cokeromyces recurvatus TaxID=90255 RepID=UPI00221FC6AE|nr:uncharacterized protein BX663DRAFT_503818 [Cokeromyces recurvatus]KAI7904857.1 hypothetical protein BX663DRAFT_503818 [Cokeromyces recurvatus]
MYIYYSSIFVLLFSTIIAIAEASPITITQDTNSLTNKVIGSGGSANTYTKSTEEVITTDGQIIKTSFSRNHKVITDKEFKKNEIFEEFIFDD